MINQAMNPAVRPSHEASFKNVLLYLGLRPSKIDINPLLDKYAFLTKGEAQALIEAKGFDLNLMPPSELEVIRTKNKISLVLVLKPNRKDWLLYRSLKVRARFSKMFFYHLKPSIEYPVRCFEDFSQNLSAGECNQGAFKKWLKRFFPWKRMPNLWVLYHD